MLVQPEKFGDKAPTEEDKAKELQEFFDRLLPFLNGQLQSKQFFCGNEMTVADLQYYHEILTLLTLTSKDLDENKLPFLSKWYSEKMNIPELKKQEAKLKEVVLKNSLLYQKQ